MDIENSSFLNIVSKNKLKQLQESGNLTNAETNIPETAESLFEMNKSTVDCMIINNKAKSLCDITLPKSAAELPALTSSAKSTPSPIQELNNINKSGYYLTNYNDVMNNNNEIIMKQATTLADLSKAQQSHVKELIFKLHKGGVTPPPVEPPPVEPPPVDPPPVDPPPVDPADPVDPPGPVNPVDPSEVFRDTDEFFEFLNKSDPTVTKETGVTRAQLIQIIQACEKWEDKNTSILGKLNRVFTAIAGNDGLLTYAEAKTIIGDTFNKNTYLNQVETYSQQVEAQYRSLPTEKAKVDFLINLSREYLTAAGLNKHIECLDRLLSEGKVRTKDCDPTNSNRDNRFAGYYVSTYNFNDDNGNSDLDPGETYWWVGDDGAGGGLWLDTVSLANPRCSWYSMVSIIVHELTHSLASLPENQRDKSKTGEYVAYQTGEDFMDSVGAGEWLGPNEKGSITSKITQNYKDEHLYKPKNDSDWVTYVA